jgi:hypothetical protein
VHSPASYCRRLTRSDPTQPRSNRPIEQPRFTRKRSTGREPGDQARGRFCASRRRRWRRGGPQDVVDLRAGASDEGEGGGTYDGRAARHRAVAQGGPQGGAQLRAALPRGLLRRHPLPPRHQELPRSGRRPHRLWHRYDLSPLRARRSVPLGFLIRCHSVYIVQFDS